jgi:hypothetical protein
MPPAAQVVGVVELAVVVVELVEVVELGEVDVLVVTEPDPVSDGGVVAVVVVVATPVSGVTQPGGGVPVPG